MTSCFLFVCQRCQRQRVTKTDRFCDYARSCQMERREAGGKRSLCMSKCVFACVLMCARIYVCIYPCLTLSLLHFMIHVANGPCISQSPTEREWVGEESPVTPAPPVTQQDVCAPISVSMHECMCVLMCVGVFSTLVQSANMMCAIWSACAHVQKKPIGSTTNPGGPCSKSGEETNVQWLQVYTVCIW